MLRPGSTPEKAYLEEADGEGATRWGLLKAYAGKRNGWISLDFAKKL